MVVHNETSTGVTSRVGEVRAAIDAAGHPALLLVDTISSLASIDYRHDEWGVDVTVAGSQKGLMLPPGLGFNAVSEKALGRVATAKLPRSYWDWDADASRPTATADFPVHAGHQPALRACARRCDCSRKRDSSGVRAPRAATRRPRARAVRAWGLEILCADRREYSTR